MKPVKKDGRRQQRRERTLARLEKQLEGGVKSEMFGAKLVDNKFVGTIVVSRLEQKDIDRISKDITILKQRLGKAA